MVKKIGLAVLFLILVSCASFAQRPERYFGLGGGLFGGMSAAVVEVDFRMRDNLYLRIGLPLADSLNLSPEKDWRRFGLLSIDGIFYFSEDSYFGAGLNYPWKISDSENPGLGGEIFIGKEIYISQRGKIYGEIGYGVASRAVGEPFAGLLLLIGWRYDIIPAIKAEKISITENTAPLIEIPTKKTPEINLQEIKKEIVLEKKVQQKKYIYHYITRGDTLIKIANKYLKISGLYKQIAKMNNIIDPDHIIGGRYIKIDISNYNEIPSTSY